MKHIFIGLGRMGVVQARLARYFGDEILLGVDVDREARHFFNSEFGVSTASHCLDEAIPWNHADIVWVTVSDRFIENCASVLAQCPIKGVVLHTSGAIPYTVLRSCGAPCGAMHPLISCPIKTAEDGHCVETYHHVIHAIEGDEQALRVVQGIVERIHGVAVCIDSNNKALYHAAAVFASNYSVALVAAAQKLFRICGFSENLAQSASSALLLQTARALEHAAPYEALTGPAKRGDVATIEHHREALSQIDDRSLLDSYDAMLRATRVMCSANEAKDKP